MKKIKNAPDLLGPAPNSFVAMPPFFKMKIYCDQIQAKENGIEGQVRPPRKTSQDTSAAAGVTDPEM